MLAKKEMSKKKKSILVTVLGVVIIAFFIITYNTFWKKSELPPVSIEGDFSMDNPAALPEYPSEEFLNNAQTAVESPEYGNGSLSASASAFKLELFELQDFKNLKAYVDLPIKIDPEKIGNKDPFFVTVAEEEQDDKETRN